MGEGRREEGERKEEEEEEEEEEEKEEEEEEEEERRKKKKRKQFIRKERKVPRGVTHTHQKDCHPFACARLVSMLNNIDRSTVFAPNVPRPLNIQNRNEKRHWRL